MNENLDRSVNYYLFAENEVEEAVPMKILVNRVDYLALEGKNKVEE